MKNIVFIGQVTDISGYGNAARSYLRTLLNLHKFGSINLKIINFSYENVEVSLNSEISNLLVNERDYISLLAQDYELIFFLTNNTMLVGNETKSVIITNSDKKTYINPYLLCKNAKKIYPCVVWETDKVPTLNLQAYKLFNDKIECLLCACKWNQQVFSRQTKLKTIVIPYAKEESNLLDPEFTEKIKQIKKDRFTFVSLSQWSYRKGFDKLIKAFLLEFRDEPVNLILKTYINRSFYDSDETRVVSQKIENEKNKLSFDGKPYNGKCSLIVINSLLDKKQINSLYEVSDCMVTCTRGEGFGLPIAEFISFKKPVIVPDKGGHLDFCSEDNFFIDSSFEPFENCPNHFYSSDMNLVEVSLSSTMKKMREAFQLYKDNKEMYFLRGKKSSNFASDYLCLDYNINAFKSVLELK